MQLNPRVWLQSSRSKCDIAEEDAAKDFITLGMRAAKHGMCVSCTCTSLEGAPPPPTCEQRVDRSRHIQMQAPPAAW